MKLKVKIKTPFRIQPSQDSHFPDIIRLLKINDLDSTDLNNDNVQLFTGVADGALAGIIGLELYKNIGLLRSLAVKNAFRDQSLGEKLIEYVFKRCRADGIGELYLLTTTAAKYFTKHGFQEIDRVDVPDEIKRTSQFSEFCPSTATVLMLNLEVS